MNRVLLIFLLILFVDVDLTLLVYGGRVVSLIALLALLLALAVMIGFVIAKV